MFHAVVFFTVREATAKDDQINQAVAILFLIVETRSRGFLCFEGCALHPLVLPWSLPTCAIQTGSVIASAWLTKLACLGRNLPPTTLWI
jgi:hypothetical protein